MKITKWFLNRMSRLSTRIFLLMLIFIIIPLYIMFIFTKHSYENFIQKELSNKTIQNISKSQQDIYYTFQSMANISNIFILNKGLKKALQDDTKNYYEKMKIFDSSVAEMTINNLFSLNDYKITIFDTKNQIYSNWSTNYNNYQFLINQDWVQESIKKNGHVVWSMFSPAFIIGESEKNEKYISLARSMLSEDVTGQRFATIIISISQKKLSEILLKYAYNAGDCIYVCSQDGETILKHDLTNSISRDEINSLFGKIDRSKDGGRVETIGNNRFLLSYYTIPEPWTFSGKQLKILYFTPYGNVINQMNQISSKMNITTILFLIIVIILGGAIALGIVRPIKKLSNQMKSYSIDSELEMLDTKRSDEIGYLNRAFYRMSGNVRELFDSLQHEHQVREKYRFESLRAQINPHFLFNTLNSIRWMAIIRKADNIVESIDALALMLKYSMNKGGELVKLRDELENIKSYIFIQNSRYGDRYQVEIDICSELYELKLIKFILQPIVENSLLHAFKNNDGKGMVKIYGDIEEEILKLYVEDNGNGVEQKEIDKFNKAKKNKSGEVKKVTGIGLTNVNERIRIEYGDRFGIEILSNQAKGTIIAYTLPIIRDGGEISDEKSDDS